MLLYPLLTVLGFQEDFQLRPLVITVISKCNNQTSHFSEL